MIFETFGDDMYARIGEVRCPGVEVFQVSRTASLYASVNTDHLMIGRLAAEYLTELGLRHFAFFGGSQYTYSQRRLEGFQDCLRNPPKSRLQMGQPRQEAQVFDRCLPGWQALIESWLKNLPRPVGIFAANDLFATEILQELIKTGWRIPEDAAVLGVDDDELQCNLAYPPISSIQPGFRQVGRAAARMLEQLLKGEEVAAAVSVPPLRVVARYSTDITHVDNEFVAEALRCIRGSPLTNLSVKVLLNRIPTNRRRLERAFVETLGRTPMEEIHRVRVLKIKELLMAGKSIEQTAREMHFSSPKYMTTLFRRITGLTPSEYQAELQNPLMNADRRSKKVPRQ